MQGLPDVPTPFLERLAVPALVAGTSALLFGVVSLATATTADQAAAVVLCILGFLITVWLLRVAPEPQDRTLVIQMVAAAIMLRLGLAMIFHTRLPTGFFAPDEITFERVGWRVLQHLKGTGELPWQARDTWEVGYFYWNAWLFEVFGRTALAPKIANCFFGGWTAIAAYRLGGELAGMGGARLTVVLVALFPSLVLWSTLNLRDTSVVLVVTVLLLTALRLRLRFTPGRALTLVVSLLALSLLRDYMALMAAFALAGSFMISPRRRALVNLVLGTGLLALAIAAYDWLGLGTAWSETTTLEWLAVQRENLAAGGSAFRPGADISTPLGSLTYLPLGLVFFLLAPFPWQIGSTLTLMTLPEMVIWYGLLWFVLSGAFHLARTQFNRVEPILIFTILTTVTYALVEGNAGTAYRHRAQVVVFFLVFASVGLDVWRQRRQLTRKKKPARVQVR